MLTYFCMLIVKREATVFAYKCCKGLDVPVCASTHSHQKLLGAQRLSGRVHEECMFRDWTIAGSSLIGVTVL